MNAGKWELCRPKPGRLADGQADFNGKSQDSVDINMDSAGSEVDFSEWNPNLRDEATKLLRWGLLK